MTDDKYSIFPTSQPEAAADTSAEEAEAARKEQEEMDAQMVNQANKKLKEEAGLKEKTDIVSPDDLSILNGK